MNIERSAYKKLKKNKVFIEAQTIDYDKDDRAIIEIGLENSESFFNPFCYKGYQLLNSQVVDFIYDNQKVIPLSDELTINIYTETATSTSEKKRIKDSLKRQYAEEFVSVKKKLKRNIIRIISFFTLGILVLALCFYLESSNISWLSMNYLDNTIMIISWVFLWDGFEEILFDRREYKRRLIRAFRVMNAKVHVRQYSITDKREYNISSDDE